MVFSSPDRRDFAEALSVRLRRDLRRKPGDRATVVLFNVFLAVALWGAVWGLRQVALSMAPGEPAVYAPEGIIGKWQAADDSDFILEFTRDGKCKMSWQEKVIRTADYDFPDVGDEIELHDLRIQPGDLEMDWRREWHYRFRVHVTRDTLTASAPADGSAMIVWKLGETRFELPPPKGRPALFRGIR
jgi:hypothetical protein